MAKKAATRQPREATSAVPPNSKIVRWSPVGHMLRDLIAEPGTEVDAIDPSELNRFARFVGGLTSPLVMLDDLAVAAVAADTGDVHAQQRLAFMLRTVVNAAALPEVSRFDPTSGGCCAPCHESRSVDMERGRVLTDADALAADSDGYVDPSAYAAIDETAAAALLVRVARLAVAGALGSDLDPGTAMDAVMSVALGASFAAALVDAHRTGGGPAAAELLGRIGVSAVRSWIAPPPVQTFMGGQMPGMPELPGVPSLPGVPGRPGVPGIPGVPKVPGSGSVIEDWLASLLNRFKKPPKWDPDGWGPWYPWWWDHPNYIDPDVEKFMRCTATVRDLLRALDKLRTAAPDAGAVWSTGISGVSIAGPCVGNEITIRGKGFGATQPTNTVLLLPTLDGCRVVAPTSWSDTKITAVLPDRVASGPVGFGDKAHIDAYNAWAAQMNDLIRKLNALPCDPGERDIVAPFGTCPPSSAINTITAGVVEIVSFTANNQTTTVLEDGEHLTLRWTVRNAPNVRITRDTAGAPLLSGSTTLTTPQLVGSHAFGAVTHSKPAEWRYTLRASGACGGQVTRTVRVYATKDPQLRIETIQVTQSLQTAANDIALIEHKPTVVRALIRHGLAGWGGDIVPNVQGRIRMLRGGAWSKWINAAPAVSPMQATPGTAITVTSSPSFNVTDETLNFMLPGDWAAGTPRYQVEAWVSGYGAVGAYAGVSQTATKYSPSATYVRRRTLQFRYVRVNWNGAGAPSAAVCENTIRGAIPLFPTPTAGIVPLPGVGIENRSSLTDDEIWVAGARRGMLDDFDDLHNCGLGEELTEWLGSDCPDDDGAIWVLIPGDRRRGEAYDVPSNVCYTPLNDGPYAAHEISHCLNQEHVRLAQPGDDPPTGGDAPSQWPDKAMHTDVPFDTAGTVGNLTGGSLPRALAITPGPGVADVMTYFGTPNNTWPIPARWKRLWNEIGG